MKINLLFWVSFLFIGINIKSLAQGGIDHIKNQGYLKYKSKVGDCQGEFSNNLAERVCANLLYQKSDSILTNIYDSIVVIAKIHYIDSLENKIIELQNVWRDFRDKNCAIIYDSYEGCGGCHQRAIDYLYCLKELTDKRIEELRVIYKTLNP